MRLRRQYTLGRCQDCGRTKPVTVIIFWVNGMRYRVCGTCIRAYRGVILKPCPPHCDRCREEARP
jgi:hypothetical protein